MLLQEGKDSTPRKALPFEVAGERGGRPGTAAGGGTARRRQVVLGQRGERRRDRRRSGAAPLELGVQPGAPDAAAEAGGDQAARGRRVVQVTLALEASQRRIDLARREAAPCQLGPELAAEMRPLREQAAGAVVAGGRARRGGALVRQAAP
jgi:hypothetical protein